MATTNPSQLSSGLSDADLALLQASSQQSQQQQTSDKPAQVDPTPVWTPSNSDTHRGKETTALALKLLASRKQHIGKLQSDNTQNSHFNQYNTLTGSPAQQSSPSPAAVNIENSHSANVNQNVVQNPIVHQMPPKLSMLTPLQHSQQQTGSPLDPSPQVDSKHNETEEYSDDPDADDDVVSKRKKKLAGFFEQDYNDLDSHEKSILQNASTLTSVGISTPTGSIRPSVNSPTQLSTILEDNNVGQVEKDFRPSVSIAVYNKQPALVQELRTVAFEPVSPELTHKLALDPLKYFKVAMNQNNAGLRRPSLAVGYSKLNATQPSTKKTLYWVTRLENFPSKIIPSSIVVRSLTDPYSSVIEMFLEQDPTDSIESILQSHVGKYIIIKASSKAGNAAQFRGKLVGADDNYIILSPMNADEMNQSSAFNSLPNLIHTKNYNPGRLHILERSKYSIETIQLHNEEFLVKPVLWVLLRSSERSTESRQSLHRLEIVYSTTGLRWKAHHNVILGPSDMGVDFTTRYLISNTTGKNYIGSLVQCIDDDEIDFFYSLLSARRSTGDGLDILRGSYSSALRPSTTDTQTSSSHPSPGNHNSIVTAPSHVYALPNSGEETGMIFFDMLTGSDPLVQKICKYPWLLFLPGHHLSSEPLEKTPTAPMSLSKGNWIATSTKMDPSSPKSSINSHSPDQSGSRRRGFFRRNKSQVDIGSSQVANLGNRLDNKSSVDISTAGSSWAYNLDVSGRKYPIFLLRGLIGCHKPQSHFPRLQGISEWSNSSIAAIKTDPQVPPSSKNTPGVIPFESHLLTIPTGTTTNILAASTRVFTHVRKVTLFQSTPSRFHRTTGNLELSASWGLEWNNIRRRLWSVVEFVNSEQNNLGSHLPTGPLSISRRMHEISGSNFDNTVESVQIGDQVSGENLTPEITTLARTSKMMGLVRIPTLYELLNQDVSDSQSGFGTTSNHSYNDAPGVLSYCPPRGLIHIYLGSVSGVYASRRRNEFSLKKNECRETFQVKIQNYTAKPVHVIIEETLSRWHEWSIVKSFPQQYDQYEYDKIRFPLTVSARSEKIMSYTVVYTF